MIAAEPTISVDLTERELHVLTCAMAGNFPPKLSAVRMPTLRKLAKAHRALTEEATQPALCQHGCLPGQPCKVVPCPALAHLR